MEIELYSKLNDPMSAIEKMGNFFAKCGMFKCSRPEQGQMLALICMVEKKSPTQISREYHVMDDGTLAPRARNIHAKFLEAGGDIDWELTGDEQTDPEKVVARAKFSFKNKTPRTLSFSVADAKRMQCNFKPGSGWTKAPARMCRARLITMAVDLFCPSIVMGSEADEADELPAQQSQTINLGATVQPAAPVAATATPTPANTVIIDVLPSEPVKAPAPAPAPVQESKPITAEPTAKAELGNDLLTKLEAAIGVDHALSALEWLRRNGQIKQGEGLANVSEAMATKIINKPDKFKEALTRMSKTTAA